MKNGKENTSKWFCFTVFLPLVGFCFQSQIECRRTVAGGKEGRGEVVKEGGH